ncbi:hypothetical protein LSH36_35g04066 [Paralvinella palmiformis]|uniref:Nucleotide-diphospho-sugar transferase domain-containing protein n=1 Tax=Paralvinella palmiformis TaxID=53620 RepID=A0AAD9K982_9ANNE|nr:hypothetical protein LSH36_35g04066 [Paralvinella palmiformis]
MCVLSRADFSRKWRLVFFAPSRSGYITEFCLRPFKQAGVHSASLIPNPTTEAEPNPDKMQAIYWIVVLVLGLLLIIHSLGFLRSVQYAYWNTYNSDRYDISQNVSASIISAITGQHLVMYYWCGKSSRMFEFQHYLSMKSAIRVLHPDVIFFLYEEYPSVDQHLMYNTWLEELRQSFPFIYVEKLKNGGACERTISYRIEAITAELTKRGGFFVHENTILTPAVSEIRNKQRVKALNRTNGYGFLMIQKGLEFGEGDQETIDCEDSSSMTSYSNIYCVNIARYIHPKDIWESEKSFGELARWAAYGETSIQRPEPDYRELVPNIAHYVWIGKGRMDYAFYLSVLSVIYVAKVDMVFIHGHRPTGYYWFKIKNDRKIYIIHRYPTVYVFGQSVSGASHRSDIWRLDFMNKYGGLYLDTDVIFVRPLSLNIRAYEAVMSYDYTTGRGGSPYPDIVQSGVMLGKRGGKFWIELMKTMRTYRDDLWTWNICHVPYKVKERHPKTILIHNQLQVNCPDGKCHPTWWPNYKNRSVHHLSTNSIPDWRNDAYGYHFAGDEFPPELRDERKALRSKTMFGEMARFVLQEAGLLKQLIF